MLKRAQYIFSTLIIAFLSTGSSCKEEPVDNLILPSNIQVTVDSSNIGDGKIGIKKHELPIKQFRRFSK